MKRPIVTLTTDFGLSDSYVAEMKAAVIRENPDCVLIDVTHLISPQDVLGASIALPRLIARPRRSTSGNAGRAGTSGSYRRDTRTRANFARPARRYRPAGRWRSG